MRRSTSAGRRRPPTRGSKERGTTAAADEAADVFGVAADANVAFGVMKAVPAPDEALDEWGEAAAVDAALNEGRR